MKTRLFLSALLAVVLMNGCGGGSNGEGTDPQTTQTPSGWYMRTEAKAITANGTEYIHKSAGVMGELEDSQEGKDRHDIAAFGAPALSVVFTQTTWGEKNGAYFSDYRYYTGNEERQVWTIQVKNNTRAADLTQAVLQLTVTGPYAVYKVDDNGSKVIKEVLMKDDQKKNNLILVDVDNQKEYSYEALQNTELRMDGLAVRTFRWVLNGSTTDSDYEPLETVEETKQLSTLSSQPQEKHGKFGLPPQF